MGRREPAGSADLAAAASGVATAGLSASAVRGRGRGDTRFFLAVALLASGLALLPQRLALGLSFDRGALARGELWRLLTSNLVHASWMHLAWNLAALALVAVAFGPRFGAAAWSLAGVACGVAASLGALLWHPNVRAMVGLSGLLHGLWTAGSLAELRTGGRLGWLFLAALVVKVGWEQLAGPLVASGAALGGPIAVEAHLYGALAGLAAGLVLPVRADGGGARR